MWYNVKVNRIGNNLFAGNQNAISLRLRANRNANFSLGGPSPNLGEEVELGGRVWYPVKLLHVSYNLFAGTEMLSLSVYDPIAIQILLGGPSPNLAEGSS